MNVRSLFCTSLVVLAGGAALFAYRAVGQSPVEPSSTVVEVREDGALVQRTLDGKILRVTQQGGAGNWARYSPASAGQPYALDAESQKLMAQEQTAAQEARALSKQAQQSPSDQEQADAKKRLHDKLVQIFDLQQQRRTREIAKIEERLARLKDVLKKRESAKDSIVDRRLETLTGGVDELGWEESLPQPTGAGYAQPNYGQPGLVPYPPVAPRAENSLAPPVRVPELPATAPAPPVALPPAASAPAAAPLTPIPALPEPARR